LEYQPEPNKKLNTEGIGKYKHNPTSEKLRTIVVLLLVRNSYSEIKNHIPMITPSLRLTTESDLETFFTFQLEEEGRFMAAFTPLDPTNNATILKPCPAGTYGTMTVATTSA